MEIGMNLPVMAPGLNRDTFLTWCERIDAGFFASLAAGERISFYNPDMTAALAAAAALTSRVKIVSGVFVPMLALGVYDLVQARKARNAIVGRSVAFKPLELKLEF